MNRTALFKSGKLLDLPTLNKLCEKFDDFHQQTNVKMQM